MRYAKINDDKVTDIFEGPTLADLEELYPESRFVPCEEWEVIGTLTVGGALVRPTISTPSPQSISLPLVKQQKVAELYQWIIEVDQQAIGKYASSERLDFQRKETEARLFLASEDPVNAPYLAIEAATAGIELAALAQVVVNKADQLRHLMAVLSGKRKLYESAINAATEVSDLELIGFGLG